MHYEKKSTPFAAHHPAIAADACFKTTFRSHRQFRHAALPGILPYIHSYRYRSS